MNIFSCLRATDISFSLSNLIILFAHFSITGWYYHYHFINLFFKYLCVYHVLSIILGIRDTVNKKNRQKSLPLWVYSSPRAVCWHLLNCRTPAASGGVVGAGISCHLTYCFFEVCVPSTLRSTSQPTRKYTEHSSTQAGDCWYDPFLFFSEQLW